MAKIDAFWGARCGSTSLRGVSVLSGVFQSRVGWRTFRVRSAEEELHADEVMCPASEEAGHSTTCLACQLCRGGGREAKSIAILAHGQRVKWFAAMPPDSRLITASSPKTEPPT
jgi:hypothetical protein